MGDGCVMHEVKCVLGWYMRLSVYCAGIWVGCVSYSYIWYRVCTVFVNREGCVLCL